MSFRGGKSPTGGLTSFCCGFGKRPHPGLRPPRKLVSPAGEGSNAMLPAFLHVILNNAMLPAFLHVTLHNATIRASPSCHPERSEGSFQPGMSTACKDADKPLLSFRTKREISCGLGIEKRLSVPPAGMPLVGIRCAQDDMTLGGHRCITPSPPKDRAIFTTRLFTLSLLKFIKDYCATLRLPLYILFTTLILP